MSSLKTVNFVSNCDQNFILKRVDFVLKTIALMFSYVISSNSPGLI